MSSEPEMSDNRKRREQAARLLAKDANLSPREALEKSNYGLRSSVTAAPMAGGSFRAMLESFLPDSTLLTRHEELMMSNNENVAFQSLKLGYQLKGHLDNEQQVNLSLDVNFGGNPDGVKVAEIIDLSDD